MVIDRGVLLVRAPFFIYHRGAAGDEEGRRVCFEGAADDYWTTTSRSRECRAARAMTVIASLRSNRARVETPGIDDVARGT